MEEIFHPPNLILSADVIPNDQLIRGVLAANATGGSFDRLAFSVMQGGWNCIKLADESGLALSVCRFPPATSKVGVGSAIARDHRVAGGTRPPPAPTERSVRICRTTLFRSCFTVWRYLAARCRGDTASVVAVGTVL